MQKNERMKNMATAKKLPSGSWRCQVYSHTETVINPDGTEKQKRVYRSFTSDIPGPKGKREAERMASVWAAGKETASKTNKTLGEAYDEYIKLRSTVLSPSTIREYKRMRRGSLTGLMEQKVMVITQDMVQDAINRETLNKSPKSVRDIHGLLSAVLKHYRPEFALNTTLPQKIPPKIYIPSEEDIRRVIKQVEGTEMEIPVLLAAFGPMRRGEICALDSDHINGNVVHVEYSLALDENNQWVKKAPKSTSGDRYIEFPDFVIARMSGITGKVTDLTPTQISHRFINIVKKAGASKFRFHDLRHYCASIQHALGIPDAYIMARGGWKNDAVLKQVYRHALEERQKEMNAVANNYFSELCNTKNNTNNEKPL